MERKNHLPPLGFLKIDWIIQVAFISLIGFCAVFGIAIGGLFIFSLLLLMPFGLWQVISGVVGALYGNRWRVKYLLVVFCYFVLVAIGAFILNMNSHFSSRTFDILVGFSLFFGFGIPVAIGISYLIRTYKDKQILEAEASNIHGQENMEDILDEAMMGDD
jgi:hypothetical protein